MTGRVWGLTLVALLALLASIVGAWATAATVFLVTAVIAGTCFAAIQFWLFAASRSNETEAQRQAAETSRLEALQLTVPGVWCHWNGDRGDEHRAADFADHLGLEPGGGFDDFVTGLAHDHAARLAGALDALRSGTSSDRFAMTVETADGGRSVEAIAGKADNSIGLVVWLREVSDTTAAADAMATEHDRLRDILDTLPLPLWRRDNEQTLIYCNTAYADIVVTDTANATAGAGIELVAEAEAAKSRDLAKQALISSEAQIAAHHVIVDGARRLLKITESPLGGETVGIALDVTDVEETSRSLDRHIEAHAAVIERLTTAIIIFGPDKQLEFFNSAYVKLYDLDRDWLLTKPLLSELLEVLRTTRKLPEMADFPDFKKKREAMFTGLIEPLEEVQFQPDGSSVRMVVAPHPFGGLLFTFEDVTDTLALESSLNTQIAVQRATLDNLYEGVAVFGSDGRLKLRNPGFARIWRLSPEQLDGDTHIADVVEQTKELYDYGDDWDLFKSRIIAHTTERTPTFNRLERSDGGVLEWASVPLPDGATLMTCLDVTDSNNFERALRERGDALKEADHLKSEFIANVSYELRTPLNTIIGFSKLLSTGFFGELEPRQAEYVRGIFDSSQHLLQLVNDILDLATIEAGHMQLELGGFDISGILASMLTLTQQRLRTENVSLDFDCPNDLGEMIGDQRRIKQVIFHLLSNAIKFTPTGGTVTLGASRDADSVSITVIDTGAGIAIEDQSRIFDKFWRRESAPLQQAGTGLGLPLVKSFVDLHGGRLDVESSPETGTRITCVLPVNAHQVD
ncbi:MAG: ATP-binding protein [Alphaproteobacteria bacterium]